MISKTSKTCYRAIIIVCSTLNVIPYTLLKNPTKNHPNIDGVFVQISPRLKWYKLYFIINILHMIVGFVILIRQIFVQNLSAPVVLSLFGFFAIMIIAGGTQTFLYFGYETLMPALNALYVLEHRLRKMYKVKSTKDGLETFLPLLNLAGAGVGLLVFPANLFLLENDHPVVRGVFASQYLGLNIANSVWLAVIVQLNTASLLFIIYLTVLHLNDTKLWLEYLKWTPECTNRRKDRNHLAYRYLQIIHLVAQNNARAVTAFVYFINIVLQVALIFFIIRLFGSMPLFCAAGFCVVMFCVLLTEFCIRASLAIEESSIECSESFLRNDFKLRAVDRAFFKSCAPLRMEVGNFFTVSGSAFYLELYQGMIIAYVTDLLISY